MSDSRTPDNLRPIPDGGLKEAMPAWLKRPPAWRNMPTVEERHERTLPDPDTSEIDPRSLVDVADLPQWLQAIAARGEIEIPQADASTDHAVAQVQRAQVNAAATGSGDSLSEPELPENTEDVVVETVETPAEPEVSDVVAEPIAQEPTAVMSETSSTRMPMIAIAAVVAIAIIILAFYLL